MEEAKRIVISGTAIPLRGDDVDTDRIIPARYMKELIFDNMGEYVFYDLRFDKDGNELVHPFNDPNYKGATLLFVGNNFGSGSSREHAPQGLLRYGIKALIGESYADIFSRNCAALGVPTAIAKSQDIARLMDYAEQNPSTIYKLNLESKTLTYDGRKISIEIPESRRQAFIKGAWDELGMLIANGEKTRATANRLPYLRNFQ